HRRGGKPNLFIKIPGTPEGLPAIEAVIFAGIPINVTLLFSREHYIAAAEAYLRGVERRIAPGVNPAVASLFISRSDVAVSDKVSSELTTRLADRAPLSCIHECLRHGAVECRSAGLIGSKIKGGLSRATRNDRPRPNGCEHGPPALEGRA